MNNRAYSVVDFKSVDEELRTIEGIATTPTADRMGDIVETDGIQFKLPLPLLYQHDSKMPIGNVIEAKASKNGIRIKAQMAAAGIDAGIDRAWNLIKAGLVRGLSIGFRPLEDAFNKETGGFRILRSEWLELSAVTIPANAEASILSVKSADAATLAALGVKRGDVVRLDSTLPGVSGQTKSRGNPVKKTTQEQIQDFENKRAANEARMTEIMAKSAEEGRTLAADESEEYDTLELQNKDIDAHLVRLRAYEKQIIARAQQVSSTTTVSAADGGNGTTTREAITVKGNRLPQGIAIARMAICQVRAQGNTMLAAELARKFYPDTPEVELIIKATVEAADTTTSGWASQLVPAAQQANQQFLELLRPMTILGKLNMTSVPFNTAVPVQSGGGTYNWVGEAAPKPVTSATFTSVTIPWYKCAGIIVITEELAKFSSPSAEMVIRNEMLKGLAQFLDTQFVGTAAAVTGVSPAGILSGVSAVSASSTTAAAFRTDMGNMLDNMTANNVNVGNIVLLMSASQAVRLSLMVTDLGVALFPNIGITGGSILGFPVIVSETVGTKIIALDPTQIFYAEDGAIRIDVSREATVEMSTTPILGDTSPSTGAALKSLWQNNLIGLRVEAYRAWIKGRTAAVEYINNVAYVP